MSGPKLRSHDAIKATGPTALPNFSLQTFGEKVVLEALAPSRDAGSCPSENISGDSCLILRPSGQLGHKPQPHVTSAARASPGEPAGFPKAFFQGTAGPALPFPPPVYSKIQGPFPHAVSLE